MDAMLAARVGWRWANTSDSRGFPLRENRFHQMQALVIAHLDPRRDFVAGAMATITEAIVSHRADTDAGTEDGAEGVIHGRNRILDCMHDDADVVGLRTKNYAG